MLLTLATACGSGGSQDADASDGDPIGQERLAMGTFFKIQVYGVDKVTASRAIDAALDEIARVEAEPIVDDRLAQ